MNILYMEQYAFHTFCFIADICFVDIYLNGYNNSGNTNHGGGCGRVRYLFYSGQRKWRAPTLLLLLFVFGFCFFLSVWSGCCCPPGYRPTNKKEFPNGPNFVPCEWMSDSTCSWSSPISKLTSVFTSQDDRYVQTHFLKYRKLITLKTLIK